MLNYKKEIEELEKVKRPQVLERVSGARAMGDLSENSEYTAAREELNLIDGRIEELEDLIKKAELIEESTSKSSSKSVQLGSQVTVSINGKKEVLHLVGEWEADPQAKKISHESPMGQALINHKVGDEVEVKLPNGVAVYKILVIK